VKSASQRVRRETLAVIPAKAGSSDHRRFRTNLGIVYWVPFPRPALPGSPGMTEVGADNRRAGAHVRAPAAWEAQTPIGMCSAERVTARGAVSSFHFDSAALTAGNGFRLSSLPRPGFGWSFLP
jgi:hypothetical protein